MATANDGVSRFADSTVYGTPTFTGGIGLGTKVPVLGQIGFTYFPTITASGAFTSNDYKTYASQLIPAGTYIMSGSLTSDSDGAVVSSVAGRIASNGGTIAYSETGDSGNVVVDNDVNGINISCIYQTASPTTITLEMKMIFTGGPPTSNAGNFNFGITRIA